MTTLYVLYRIIVLSIIFLSLSVSTCHALSLNTKNDHSSKNSLIARSSRKAAASNQQEQRRDMLLSRRQAMALVLGTATQRLYSEMMMMIKPPLMRRVLPVIRRSTALVATRNPFQNSSVATVVV
jgi:hypothetical protein